MTGSFERDPRRAEELGAPTDDIAQEAIDATATAYANDAAINVAQHLRAQLSSRGLGTDDRDWIERVAHEIRSGHRPHVGRSDGSVHET